jgi:signal transduction histidine kinase
LAWQSVVAALILNLCGMPIELVWGRSIPPMPRWPTLATMGLSATFLVLMLWRRPRVTARQAAWVFFLHNVAIVSELWFTSGYYVRAGIAWAPFQPNKLGVLTVALLAPSGLASGLISLGLFTASALVRFWTFAPELQGRLRPTEPWAMMAFSVFAVGLLIYRIRTQGLREQLDRAHMEAALLERESETLRESVQARDTFLTIASHELKTPLTPMTLRLQVLARATEAQADSEFVRKVRSYLSDASRQLNHLKSLVEELLNATRMSSGHVSLDLAEVDLAALVREITRRFEGAAASSGIRIVLDAPASLKMRTASFRLDQVVTNLVDNAIKYGLGHPVEVRVTSEGGNVIIAVTDHGIGIAPENLSRIFERYQRAVSERYYSGFGLGLYISQTIAESLGGNISVQSQIGRGSTFTVTLPARGPDGA